MKSFAIAKASILRPILNYLKHEGCSGSRYLNEVKLSETLVDSDAWIAKQQLYDFLSLVAYREGCEEIGFAPFVAFELKQLGGIAKNLQSATTLVEGLSLFSAWASRAFHGNSFWLEREGEWVWFCNRVLPQQHKGWDCAQQGSVMLLFQLLRWGIGKEWRPQQIRMQPKETVIMRRAEGLEDCRIQGNQPTNAIAFPAKLLSRSLAEPSTRSTDSAHSTLEHKNLQSFHQFGFRESLAKIVESRLFLGGLPTLQQVGKMIGLSPRTIKRRLRAEGVTYRFVLDQARLELAKVLLLDPQLTLGDVARELGYSGPNNFCRAFKRLTGVTPTKHRHLVHSPRYE